MKKSAVIDSVAVPGTGGLGSLERLPQELRDKIYETVFDSGHTALLRVSKCMHQNAKDILSRDRVLRANIVHYEFRTWWEEHCRYFYEPSPPSIDVGRIQNLHITITISGQDTPIRCGKGADLDMSTTYAESILFLLFRNVVLSHQEASPLRSAAGITGTSRNAGGRACSTVVVEGLPKIECQGQSLLVIILILHHFVSFRPCSGRRALTTLSTTADIS